MVSMKCSHALTYELIQCEAIQATIGQSLPAYLKYYRTDLA